MDLAFKRIPIFNAHIASTTNVHGIADTSKLAIGFGPLVEATDYLQWSFQPDSAQDGIARGPFQSIYSGAKFGAYFDNTWGYGYNISAAGRALAGEAAFWDALETDFLVGGIRIFERYTAYITDDGLVSTRPTYIAVDRHTGDSQVLLTGNGATGSIDLLCGAAQMKMVPTGVNVFSGLPFTWVGTGGKSLIQAQNNAGLATIGVLALDIFDRILLGSNGVVNVDDAAQKLGFFNTSPLTKRTATGAWGSPRASVVMSDLLGSYGLINDSTVAPRIDITYSASMTPNCATGTEFIITATNGTAFTINAPTNTIQAQRITIRIRNNSGGALGAITWNAAYKMSAWTSPANQFSRAIDLQFDGGNWIEVSRTPSDVPF